MSANADPLEAELQQILSAGHDNLTSIRDLIRREVREGKSRSEVKSRLAGLLADPALQRRLSEWNRIEDREELRIRMELIRRLSSVEPELDDFVTFFFRSSDPVMYQTAALALGCHMQSQPRLKEYLLRYMNRHLPDSAPEQLELNGERSRRRLLLAFSAGYATGAGTGFPLSETILDSPALDDPSDLNVAMIALSTILDEQKDDSQARKLSSAILRHVSERGFPGRDRSLARNWSHLLAATGGFGPEERTGIWFALLHRITAEFRSAPLEAFSLRLELLLQIDELVHGAQLLDPDSLRAISQNLPKRVDRSVERFYLVRSAFWQNRMSISSAEIAPQGPDHADRDGPDTLDRAAGMLKLRNKGGRGLFDEPHAELGLFVTLFKHLQHADRWFGLPAGERLFVIFFLLDLTVHELEEHPQLSQLLDLVTDIPLPGANRSTPRISPTIRLLLLLQEREGLSRLPTDSNLIHQIADPELLLAFAANQHHPDFLAILADAFEHRIRLELVRKPDFSVAGFLYRITSARPDPDIFDFLAKISKGRPYMRSDGEPVPVHELVHRFRQEMKAAIEVPGNEESWPFDLTPAGADSTEVLFLDTLREIRKELLTLYRLDDLFETLQRLADLLEPSFEEASTRRLGISDLLRIVSDAERPISENRLFRNGERPNELLNRLRHLSSLLLPHTVGEIPAVHDARLQIRRIMDEITGICDRKLGRVDRKLFRLCIDDLLIHLQEWVDALDRIQLIFRDLHPEKGIGKAGWERLFSVVQSLPTPSMRRHLIDIVYRSLLLSAEKGFEEDLRWNRRHNLVRHSVLAPYKKGLDQAEQLIWESRAADAWVELCEKAMQQNYETRVQNLLEEKSFHSLFERPAASEQLQKVRAWFYERYNPGFMRMLGNMVGSSLPEIGRQLMSVRSYLLHFTHIWIALIIGAILMFDFGDAWTALAEIGDERGIIITFLLGLSVAGFYLYLNLRSKSANAPEDQRWERTVSRWIRVVQFLAISLAFSFAVTSLLWYLFSSTDEVVHGAGAILHIVAWTGFTLLIGIFFGLISKAR